MSASAVLLTIAILATSALCRPGAARCPAGYDLRTGIQRDGWFTCWPNPVGDPEWDGTWLRAPDGSAQSADVIMGRLYCTGGSRPIVASDSHAVVCQR